MLETLKNGAEPHMLNATLPVRVYDEAEVFGSPLEVESEHELPLPGLTLPDQEESSGVIVSRAGTSGSSARLVRLILEHQLSRIRPTQRPVEPGILKQPECNFRTGVF